MDAPLGESARRDAGATHIQEGSRMRRLAVLAATMLACVVPATAQAKVQFGLSTDTPGEFAAVQRQMHVDLDAPFVGFKAAPDFTYYLTRAKAYGVRAMITWEPW